MGRCQVKKNTNKMDHGLRPREDVVQVEWIDVRKRLPDSDLTVIIHCPDEDEPVQLAT